MAKSDGKGTAPLTPLAAVLNAGSSSLKYDVLDGDGNVVVAGVLERIGSPGGLPSHAEATRAAIADLDRRLPSWKKRVAAVGHRVVHGGPNLWQPTRIDDAVLAELERCTPLAPLHLPPALASIRAAREDVPARPHVAVFDTGFHHDLPEVARAYAIPPDLAKRWSIRRYGFHGISCSYLAERLKELDPSRRRVVLAHLGAGASVTAMLDGHSVDTSMGFTPLEGLVMATRSGDLDPAVPLYLQSQAGLTADEVSRILERESGLKGLSGLSGDFREIEAGMKAGVAAARLAFDLFANRIRKYLGAYSAVLGGIDAIVFAAGIGENSATLRAAVIEPLAHLGLHLDPKRNESGPPERRVSPDRPESSVWVIPTNEALAIARAALALGS